MGTIPSVACPILIGGQFTFLPRKELAIPRARALWGLCLAAKLKGAQEALN